MLQQPAGLALNPLNAQEEVGRIHCIRVCCDMLRRAVGCAEATRPVVLDGWVFYPGLDASQETDKSLAATCSSSSSSSCASMSVAELAERCKAQGVCACVLTRVVSCVCKGNLCGLHQPLTLSLHSVHASVVLYSFDTCDSSRHWTHPIVHATPLAVDCSVHQLRPHVPSSNPLRSHPISTCLFLCVCYACVLALRW